MTITSNKPKRILFFLFTGLAIFVMAACNNNDSSSSDKTAADSTASAAAAADSAKAVKKVRKARVSARIGADSAAKMAKDKDGVYYITDTKPEYPGGDAALSKFIEENVSYPQDAIDQNAEGTSTVSFVVDEKGMVTKPVTAGAMAGHGLDDEAIKVVGKMPAWKPGMVKGKAVKTRLQLPVTFKLEE